MKDVLKKQDCIYYTCTLVESVISMKLLWNVFSSPGGQDADGDGEEKSCFVNVLQSTEID